MDVLAHCDGVWSAIRSERCEGGRYAQRHRRSAQRGNVGRGRDYYRKRGRTECPGLGGALAPGKRAACGGREQAPERRWGALRDRRRERAPRVDRRNGRAAEEWGETVIAAARRPSVAAWRTVALLVI